MQEIQDKQLMARKFRIAVILMLVPVFINLALTVLCYLNYATPQFKGYFVGTFLSMFFSLIWIFMARKISLSNIMVLFTLSLGLFPVKLILFALFAFGGLYLLQMNQLFFGFSFLLGTVLSLFVEVWFVLSVNKLYIKRKASAPGAR